MTSHVVRTLAELGPRITLAPERYREERHPVKGVPLADLVVEVREGLFLRAGDRAVCKCAPHTVAGRAWLFGLLFSARHAVIERPLAITI